MFPNQFAQKDPKGLNNSLTVKSWVSFLNPKTGVELNERKNNT